jgi:hypothetical protein
MNTKEYYIIKNKTQLGPFSIDELKKQKITRTTPIWYEGIDKWTTAEKIDHLSSIVNSAPPEFNSKYFYSQQLKSSLKIIFGLIIIIIMIIILFKINEIGKSKNNINPQIQTQNINEKTKINSNNIFKKRKTNSAESISVWSCIEKSDEKHGVSETKLMPGQDSYQKIKIFPNGNKIIFYDNFKVKGLYNDAEHHETNGKWECDGDSDYTITLETGKKYSSVDNKWR